jgi:signal transduction histidine kinase
MVTESDGILRIPFPSRFQGNSVSKSSPDVERFSRKEGLTAASANTLLEDSEGNTWVGTDGGLDRFRHRNLLWTELQPHDYFLNLVAGDHGDVWAGSSDILIRVPKRPTPQTGPRWSDFGYRDPNGAIWLWGGVTIDVESGDLWRWQNGQFVKVNLPDTAPVRAMARDGAGNLWVSIRGSGVFRQDHGVWKLVEIVKGQLHMTAYSALADSDGRVWLGYPELKKVGLWDHGTVHSFSAENGLTVGAVNVLAGRDQQVWVAGELGLACFKDGRFQTVEAADGVGFGNIAGLVATANEGLWFSSGAGIVHIPQGEVHSALANADHKVRYESYDLVSDLPEAPQGALRATGAVEGSDGILWFATPHGVARIDPAHIIRNPLPPPVSILSIVADGKSHSVSADLSLPPRIRDLHIDYTAVSLSIPERVRFRYRLEGVETEWRDAGARRTAFYTDPRPGSFRFHVIACNNDGVWNEAGAVTAFTIQPAFSQTYWFLGLCICAAGCLLWTLYLLRLKQATAQVRGRLEERLSERERIARELHDTLLQGFQGLTLHFQAAMKQIPEQEPARQTMDRALRFADQVLLEGRERVRDLRTDQATGNELSDLLASYGGELSQDRKIGFKMSVIGSPLSLHAVVQDDLYRIVREALSNAFQHSQASNIEVEVTYDPARVSVRVRDNGCGIDAKTLNGGRQGHWGLSGMRERARKISAQFSIWSNLGAGTEVDLSVPAKVAYVRTGNKSRWKWIKRGSQEAR